MWQKILENSLAPPCIECQKASFAVLCLSCRQKLRFRGLCRICGRADLLPHQIDCFRCEALSPPWGRLRVEFIYSSSVGHFFYQIKRAGKPELWKEWLQLLPPVFPFAEKPSALVVIPNETLKSQALGYSSSEQLGRLLSFRYQIPFRRLLVRKPQLQTQKERDRYERQSQLSQALNISPDFSIQAFPSILLVDDVMTTGASLWIAAERFHAQGCRLDAWVMARVASSGT